MTNIYELDLRRASVQDTPYVLELLKKATCWLRDDKKLDQWSGGEAARIDRVVEGIRRGHTWILMEDPVPVATLTLDSEAPEIWVRCDAEREVESHALYAHRLIVNRDERYRGQAIGAELLDWASNCAIEWGYEAVRVDVWTGNVDLHEYYLGQDFTCIGDYGRLAPGYTAGMLFERKASSSPLWRIRQKAQATLDR